MVGLAAMVVVALTMTGATMRNTLDNSLHTYDHPDIIVSSSYGLDYEDKEILKGVNLTINTGEIHAIMGPNGTGKSTLSSAIMGHPSYEVTQGEVLLDGVNILELDVDERAKAGLFLAMQYPSEITGVTNADFMRSAINAKREEGQEINLMQFIKKLDKQMDFLDIDKDMAQRYLNEGFSGGEKKRNEILQLMMLEPVSYTHLTLPTSDLV